jgi:hypothetical protein
MRRLHPATVICGILAILFFVIAYNCATLPHLTLWFNDHQRTFTRAENPVVFWAPAVGALILAVLCLLATYHLHFRLRLSRPVIEAPAILKWIPLILPAIAVLAMLIAMLIYVLQR